MTDATWPLPPALSLAEVQYEVLVCFEEIALKKSLDQKHPHSSTLNLQ